MVQELLEAMSRRHPDAFCLGGVCYFRLGRNLAKAELSASSGYYDGLRLTVLNPCSGPVDSLTIRARDLPRRTAELNADGEDEDIYRPALDIEAFSEAAEQYLRLFQEPDTEVR